MAKVYRYENELKLYAALKPELNVTDEQYDMHVALIKEQGWTGKDDEPEPEPTGPTGPTGYTFLRMDYTTSELSLWFESDFTYKSYDGKKITITAPDIKYHPEGMPAEYDDLTAKCTITGIYYELSSEDTSHGPQLCDTFTQSGITSTGTTLANAVPEEAGMAYGKYLQLKIEASTSALADWTNYDEVMKGITVTIEE